MLKRNATVVAFGLLLAAMLILPVTARSQGEPPAGSPPSSPAMPGPGMGHFGQAQGPHTAIQRAMRMLEHVKMTLQKDAAKDVGGHKAEAVKSVDAAIGHLKLAQEAEKK